MYPVSKGQFILIFHTYKFGCTISVQKNKKENQGNTIVILVHVISLFV